MKLSSLFFIMVLTAAPTLAANLGLSEPYETVTEQYLIIHDKLATDNFDGLIAAAQTIQKTVAADPHKTFPPEFAQAVDRLAATTDLHTARLAYKAVSIQLIDAFKLAKISTGALHEVYCPMANAYWIQSDPKMAHNPYFGKARENCGDTVANF
ncbi:MAG: hypothetical protein LV481_12085 [Methylacidiphilales bacterium]|nr:hypothetical protein [Candidatus Methylacidiphilales bacterium]